MGIGLGFDTSDELEFCDCAFEVGCEDVQIVWLDAATAPEEDMLGWALGSCVECARNAARKLLRNGRWVGIVVRQGPEATLLSPAT